MNGRRDPGASVQRGAILIISIIILLVLTMLGLAAIRLTTTNLYAVTNMQARQDAIAAGQAVINEVLSTALTDADGNLKADFGGVAKDYSYVAGGGKTYTVAVATPCLKSISPLLNREVLALEDINPLYSKCRSSEAVGGTVLIDGGIDPTKGNCFHTVWQVKATISSGFLGAKNDMVQGAEIIVNTAAGAKMIVDAATYRCAW
jgi:hypothetical protein